MLLAGEVFRKLIAAHTIKGGEDMDFSDFLPNAPEPDFGIPGWEGLGSGLLGLSASKPQYIIKTESDRIAFKSMLEMNAEENSSLPSEPIEMSSFATYNRIIDPVNAKCRLALQGSDAEIQSTLNKLSELRKGLEKLTLITPSASYSNLMLQSFDYRKDNHTGHNVLIVDLTFIEVREVASFLTTSSVTEPEPEAAHVTPGEAADGSVVSTEDMGEVQAQSPSSSESDSAQSDNRTAARQIGDAIRGGW